MTSKTKLSKLSREKMQELVGMQIMQDDKMQTITKVEDYKNMFDEVTGYKIFTTGNQYSIHYPDNIMHIARDGRLVIRLELPQEYMDDVKQATEEKKILESENKERITNHAKIQSKERIANRYKETNGEAVYRVFIAMDFSFHYVRSTVKLRVGHESGTIELPRILVGKEEIMQLREKKTAQMTPEEIAEFFKLYEQFDFYALPPDRRSGLDGWSLAYNIFDGQTDLWASCWCPQLDDNNIEWCLFCKYTLNLLKTHLPAEDYNDVLCVLKEYTGRHFARFVVE